MNYDCNHSNVWFNVLSGISSIYSVGVDFTFFFLFFGTIIKKYTQIASMINPSINHHIHAFDLSDVPLPNDFYFMI